MSEESKRNYYKRDVKTLGSRLRLLREKRAISVAEVSGAVEIDQNMLDQIESGKQRPSQDILMLLISYFGVPDTEAGKLWKLAGYPLPSTSDESQLPMGDTTQAVMVLPVDARVVYTDLVHIIINDYGVMLNFMQSVGLNNQPLAIARLGMSREHAKSLLGLLQQTLAQSEPKALPVPKQKHQNEP